ncbi:hypothetical protein HPP92_026380 [Vanilla planifolia]|uniref:Uncharacterized protein n=1 Tax=Vanilla planifolia TaxID=51239 RepID=A0A835U7R4_VANPL|nr:hypothetical protein HPP92_026380 [Vanilla planifolia]
MVIGRLLERSGPKGVRFVEGETPTMAEIVAAANGIEPFEGPFAMWRISAVRRREGIESAEAVKTMVLRHLGPIAAVNST